MKGFFVIVFSCLLIACQSNTGSNDEKNKPHAYFFYPKSNVYVDTADKSFIYFDSSTKKWVKGNPPASVLADLGKSVLIDSAPQPVWAANAEHRMIYAATLYADSTDFKEPPAVAKKSKKKKDKGEEDGEQGEKKKTRLGELIEKIFKRKEKEKEQN